MANPSLQIGNSNWAIKEDNLLGYSTAGTRFVPQPITMTRASAGTRVNSSGLVETVELLGSEEVTNGDFATDSDWSLGSGWSIANQKATRNSTGSYTNITQGGILTVGKNYKVKFTVNEGSIGGVRIQLGGTYYGDYNGVGTYTIYGVSGATAFNNFSLVGEPTFNGSISNVSVKESTKNNLARVDYDGTASSLLVEPQRTNLVTYSSDFSQSYWTKQSGVTATYNTTETLSPDGTYNATKFIGNGSSGVLKSSISATGVVARSVYLKSVTGTVNVKLKDPNATVTTLTLDVTTEWQRFDLTEDNGTAFQGLWIDDIPVSGIYMWGAQLEEGSYATSYIPTDGSTVTRVQDQYSKTGISNLINSEEGVLFVEMAVLAADTINRYISLSNGTDDNSISFHFRNNTNNQVRVILKSGNVNQFDSTYNPSGSTAFAKVAFKYKVNDFALWVNGTEIATDTSGITFSADTLNRLAFDDGQGGGKLFGKVKQLQVFKTALTDSELIALTT